MPPPVLLHWLLLLTSPPQTLPHPTILRASEGFGYEGQREGSEGRGREGKRTRTMTLFGEMFDELRAMSVRQLVSQVLGLGLIVTSAFMIWKCLILATGSESPVSGSLRSLARSLARSRRRAKAPWR